VKDTLEIKGKLISISEMKSEVNFENLGSKKQKIEIPNNISYYQLSDLVKLSSSIHVNDYGGVGDMKTVSIRGTNSQQNVIAIEGVPLNSSSNSYIDLAKLPMDLFSSVDILKSGNSANYGSGAIGGIMNLKINKRDNPHISFRNSIGSFGFYSSTAKFDFNFIEIPFFTSINYIGYEGDYNIKFNNFGDLVDTNRRNNEFSSLNFSSNYNKQFNNIYLSITNLTNISTKGLPGSVLIGRLEDSKAKLEEKQTYFITNLNYTLTKNSYFNFKNLLSYSDSKLDKYQEYLTANDYSYYSFQNKFITSYNLLYEKILFNLTNEIDYNKLTGLFLQPELNNKVHRYIYSNSALLSKIFQMNNYILQASYGIRYDYFSNLEKGNFSQYLGCEFSDTSSKFAFLLNFSKNFRAPSFNEMYYLNYGNTDLIPETSYSYSTGCDYSLCQNIQFSTSFFYNNTFNQIVSIPKNPMIWTAQNFARVVNYGIDFELNIDIFENTVISNLGYTIQNPKDMSEESLNYGKLVPYIPQEQLTFNLEGIYRNFKLSSNFQYSSFTYSLPDNSYYSLIPEYISMDISFQYIFQFGKTELISHFQVKNVLNKYNMMIINYPLPGRNFVFNLIYNLNS